MLIRSVPLFVLLGISLAGIVQNIGYAICLPDRVAIHFGWAGQADGWMPRSQAVLVMGLFQIGLPWFLLGVMAVARHFPRRMVNLPHRDYWLHPDRAAETLRDVGQFISWLAVAVALFTMGINHLTFVANRGTGNLHMPMFLLLFGFYLLSVMVMIVRLWLRFGKPERTE